MATTYGVYPHAECHSDGAPVLTGRGYVVRAIDCGVPYTRMEPVRTYKSERAAQKHADKLTFG